MLINNKIKNEMNRRGWDIDRLSQASGVSKTAIKGWFKDPPAQPTYDSVRQVAKAFGMPAEQLLDKKSRSDAQKHELLAYWDRLEKKERDAVLAFMKVIVEDKHNGEADL